MKRRFWVANGSAVNNVQRGVLIGGLLAFGVSTLLPGIVAASSLSVGYTTTQQLPSGSLVSPDSQKTGAVVAANSIANNNLLGVAVGSSTVTVTQDNSTVQVSTDGITYVLVSSINGSIKNGDRVTASPLDGIGMKATDSGKVVGVAQGDLTSSSLNAQTKSVTDVHGAKKDIIIGMVPLTINVAYFQPPESRTVVPKLFRDLSSSISGKQVSMNRLWGSLGIMLITLIIVVVLLYGAVRSSIGAIGRNPLAKSAIQRSMSKVIGLALVILGVCSGVIYLILKG
jgi:hypothetical protein